MTASANHTDAFSVRLDDDLLIEASAGTGKTYALTTLVARLIVEQGRRIDQLLVVTFTIAAAGELRDRVWRTFQATRQALRDPNVAVDGPAHELAAMWRGTALERTALRRLTGAIRDFDRANITTIHGFCQRALAEFALPAGTPFTFEVSGDDTLAVGAATGDFWRQHVVDEPVTLLEYAKAEKFVLDEKVTAWVRAHHAKQHDIRGVDPAEDFAQAFHSKHSEWSEEIRSTRSAWTDRAQRERFLEISDPARWKKNDRDPRRTRTLVDAFDAGVPELLAPNYAGFFARGALDSKLYKGDSAPPDSLYDCFERLGKVGDEYGRLWLADRRRRLLDDVRKTLHHYAWAHRRLSFNDLLTELHRALSGQAGPKLAQQIRARYPVALIDEFQDTDRLQAEIFEKLYAAGSGTSNGSLFVVGDPKQSIYRFRGADVYAYLDAGTRIHRTGDTLKLEENYRSTGELVRAVNLLFASPRPFLLQNLPFQPVQAASRKGRELVRQGDADDSRPFHVDLFRKDGKPLAKPAMEQLAAQRAASEIARLLDPRPGRRTILAARGTPVSGGDIAVLVRKGRQGQAVARALRDGFGIETVEMGTDNVFESSEAGDLHRLLYALCSDEASHRAPRRLRGALAADLFGLDMRELAALRDDDATWTRWRGLAQGWEQIWREQGIAALMRHVLFASETRCAANLLRYGNGPRRLTNFLHLTDLLHETETRHRPSRQGLLDWLARSRAESNLGHDTAQLRLESDENLVKIVTIHRAKGLEFPIVFCPFAWDGRPPPRGKQRSSTAEYYDHERGTPVLDLCPTDDAYDQERVEEHADELRLLYVALTRAKYRCVVTWAQANTAEHSPLAWLLHGRGTDDGTSLVAALDDNAAHVRSLTAEAWRDKVRGFADKAPEAISISEIDPLLPDTGEPPRPSESDASGALEARKLGRQLESIRQRTSYSALSTDAGAARSESEHEEAEQPDHDPVQPDAPDEVVTAEPPAEDDELTVFTFPAGNRPGRCLHEIFERRLQPENALDSICEEALTRYRIHAKWQPVVRALVEDTLNTPLARPGEGGSVFRVADLERPVAEMEFHLPVHGLRRSELAQTLREHGYEYALPDAGGQINGFLHGYIDVVAQHEDLWYVMDFKSNWLGRNLAAYSRKGLVEAMRHHGYYLQYLLYLTALHRLLRLRLPEYDYDRHIGGAFYLFVRGMRPSAPGSGVFRNRPPRACIEAIDACFGGTQ